MSQKRNKKNKKKPTFEESYPIIDKEIKKRRGKWLLTSIRWMDFDDVAQIIRVHIYEKWELYDHAKPLRPWLNAIISNQIKNLIRNYYGNFSRPCLKCPYAVPPDKCAGHAPYGATEGAQDSDCSLYAKWEKNKKYAYDLKLPCSLENHSHEVSAIESSGDASYRNIENINKFQKEIRKHLKPYEWKVYEALYIKNLSEEQAAEMLGYTTSEKGRSPGYKQIKNIIKSIIIKSKKLLENKDVDIY